MHGGKSNKRTVDGPRLWECVTVKNKRRWVANTSASPSLLARREEGERRDQGARDEHTSMPSGRPHDAGETEDACEVSSEVLWDVMQSFVRANGVARHQIDAYDHFLHKLVPQIVADQTDVVLHDEARKEVHMVNLCNASVGYPVSVETDGRRVHMTPRMALNRNTTYSVGVRFDVVHDVHRAGKHLERRIFRSVPMCSMPLMLGSSACHSHNAAAQPCSTHFTADDPGGYFIVGGIEKVLIAQERLRTNVPFVFPTVSSSKYQLQCEIRSCSEAKLKSTSTFVIFLTSPKRGRTPELVVSLPFLIQSVLPLYVMFRLLGVDTREEALSYVIGEESGLESKYVDIFLSSDPLCGLERSAIVEHVSKDTTTEATKEKRVRFLEHILCHEFLPQMGTDASADTFARKAKYMGLMTRKLLRVFTGKCEPDQRDDYASKRVDASPCGMLFRQVHRAMVKNMISSLNRCKDTGKLRWTNVSKFWPHKRMTQSLRYAFSTGSWGLQVSHRNTTGSGAQSVSTTASSHTGITQVLSRMSVVSMWSNLRRTNTPISREGKAPKPRQLHATAWGDDREGVGWGGGGPGKRCRPFLSRIFHLLLIIHTHTVLSSLSSTLVLFPLLSLSLTCVCSSVVRNKSQVWFVP